MSIGMTYDEFWNQDVALVRVYRKADELRRRRQNDALWMQGLYIRDALLSTVGNMFSGKNDTPIEYPKEPYPITADQVAEREEAERRKMEERMKADFMALAARMIEKQMPKEAHPDVKGGENNGYHD
jgi:hypothetical protein